MKKVAVILCGSGFKDGSEIRESVAVLWALSQLPVEVNCFAPDLPQMDVMNCLTFKPMINESRNMLVEAARIARGKIQPLSKCQAKDFNAVIIPGGFGVAKNLCTFANQGSKASVLPELKTLLLEMHAHEKPLGAVCIAPTVLALTFPGKMFTMTLGEESEASQELVKLGHVHKVATASECCVDKKNRIVTTPAYMCDSAPLHEIFTGIQKCVQETVALCG